MTQCHLCFSAARLSCLSFLLRAISLARSCFLQAEQDAAGRQNPLGRVAS